MSLRVLSRANSGISLDSPFLSMLNFVFSLCLRLSVQGAVRLVWCGIYL